jgi:hypothetical protein
LEELLNDPAVQVPGDHTRAGESCHAGRVNTVDSLFGPLTLRRNYYSQRDPAAGRAPWMSPWEWSRAALRSGAVDVSSRCPGTL